MIDAVTQTMLIPGSIWKKEGRRRDFYSTVLFVTNGSLSDDKLEDHPQQVVFLNENHQVMSQELNFFVGQRSYSDMDPDMEALLTAVVTPLEEEEDDDIDIDKIVLDEDGAMPSPEDEGEEEPLDITNLQPDAELGLEVVGDLTANTQASHLAPMIQPLVILGGNALATTLQESFVSYQESPHATGGDTQHVLKFALSDGLGLQELREAFGVDFDDSINEFVVNSARAAPTLVQISGYIEVFLEVQGSGRALGCVYLTSDGDIRRQPNGGEATVVIVDDTPPLKIEDEVETPAAPAPVAQPNVPTTVQVKVAPAAGAPATVNALPATNQA